MSRAIFFLSLSIRFLQTTKILQPLCTVNPLVVRPLLLELAAALKLDVEDELDGDEELPPGLGAALGHLRAQGLAEILDEALERKLAPMKLHKKIQSVQTSNCSILTLNSAMVTFLGT